MMCGRRGLTLIETLVVMAAVLLLASVSMGTYRALEGARARNAAEQIASLMRRVVQVAWAERAPHRIVFAPGTGTVRVERWDGSAWREATGGIVPDWLYRAGALPNGVIVESNTYPGNVFLAHPYALSGIAQLSASTTPGQVTVRSPGGTSLTVESGEQGDIRVR